MKRQLNTLYERARSAWFQYCEREGYVPLCPSLSDSQQLTTSHERTYIVLANVNGILAVYRVRPNGTLRRITRVPQEIQALY